MSREYGDLREWKTDVESIGMVVQEHHHLEDGKPVRHDGYYAHRKDGSIGAIWHNHRTQGHVFDLPPRLIQIASTFNPDDHAYDKLERRFIHKHKV